MRQTTRTLARESHFNGGGSLSPYELIRQMQLTSASLTSLLVACEAYMAITAPSPCPSCSFRGAPGRMTSNVRSRQVKGGRKGSEQRMFRTCDDSGLRPGIYLCRRVIDGANAGP